MFVLFLIGRILLQKIQKNKYENVCTIFTACHPQTPCLLNEVVQST